MRPKNLLAKDVDQAPNKIETMIHASANRGDHGVGAGYRAISAMSRANPKAIVEKIGKP